MLPFCHIVIQAQKPHQLCYPHNPKTLGEHIRKRRLDLRLTLKDVERLLDVSYRSVSDWEKGKFFPTIKVMPNVIEFLGYNPFGDCSALDNEEKIRMCRKLLGLNTKEAAKHLGVTSATISLWENGKVVPTKSNQKQLQSLFTSACHVGKP
ncbi:helix-turn-helix domain-containing protein [bacterium]|nr:helix-turn-helix domain-containing protein [bacterium]